MFFISPFNLRIFTKVTGIYNFTLFIVFMIVRYLNLQIDLRVN